MALTTALLSIKFCAGLALSRRSSSESCRAGFQISQAQTLCIPRARWVEILENGIAPCGSWTGKWKSYSPVDHHAETPKETAFQFEVQDFAPTLEQNHLSNSGVLFIERLRERISETLEDHDDYGIMRELLLGERANPRATSVLAKIGFFHLTSASGIHLLFLVWLIDRISCFAFFGTRVSLSKKISRTLSVLVCTFACLLSSLRVGMLRAIAILAVRTVARFFGLQLRSWAPFIVVFGIEIISVDFISPSLLIYPLAIAGCFLGLETSKKRKGLAIALGAWSLPALFECLRCGWVTFAAPMLSIVTVPVFAGLFYPASLLLILIGKFQWLGILDEYFTACVKFLAEIFLHLPLFWSVSKVALLVSFCVVGALVFIPLKRKIKLIFAFSFIIAAHYTLSALQEQRVIQLDVGQGDAALIVNGNGAGLIDSGHDLAVSESQWIEILSRNHVDSLDWIVLTHLDRDHSGGVFRLGELLPIRCVSTSLAELTSERGKKYATKVEELGVSIRDLSSDCYPFPRYNPPLISGRKKNANMAAFLIPLDGGGFYLSPGDADEKDELQIAQWFQKTGFSRALAPRILKISHHGSRTSSNEAFLRSIRPSETWISVGVGNHYGHPSIEVLSRLEKMPDSAIKRTDIQGEIRWPDHKK